MISLLFFNALIFTVQGFDNQIVFYVTINENPNRTMDVVCSSANKVYNLKHLESSSVLFKTTKSINNATCRTFSNYNEITKSNELYSNIVSQNEYRIEKMITKRDFGSTEGQHQKIICKLLTLAGLTVKANKQHQVTYDDTVYYEATCTADIHVFVAWTEGLDPNRIQYQVENHTVIKYSFYPTEEVVFVKSPRLEGYSIVINVTYDRKTRSHNTSITDKFTFPAKVPYVCIELSLIDSNGIINKCFNIEAKFSKVSWIEGFKQERLKVSYSAFESVYNYTFYPNEEVVMRCVYDKPGNTEVELYNDRKSRNLIANGTNVLEYKKILLLSDHKKIFAIYFKTPVKNYDNVGTIEVNLKSFMDVSIEMLDWQRVEVSGSNTAFEYKYTFYPNERLDLRCSQLQRSLNSKVTFKELVLPKSPSHIGTHDTYVEHSVTLNESYTGASFVCTLEPAAGAQSKVTLLLYYPCKLWFDGFNMGRLNLVSISDETTYFDYLFYPSEQLKITCRNSLLSLDSDKALIHHNFTEAYTTNTNNGMMLTTTLQWSDNGTSLICYTEPYQVFKFKMQIQDIWFSDLDPRAVLEELSTTTFYHFYPNEVLHFKCVSSNFKNGELDVIDANNILVLENKNKTEVDYRTKPLSKIYNQKYIECKQKNTYYIRSTAKEVVTAHRILEFKLGPLWVEGLPEGTAATRYDWGLLYDYRFNANDSIHIECKTSTQKYIYAVQASINKIQRQSASSVSIDQPLNKDDDGKHINCTILDHSIATSLRTIIINLNLITDNYINPGLVHAASSCGDNNHYEHSLNMAIQDTFSINQELIQDYCEGDTMTLTCKYDTSKIKPVAMYNYVIYKCLDVACSKYDVTQKSNSKYDVHQNFELDKSYDNSRYGCGMVESPSNIPILLKGRTVYTLKLHKPTTTSTETSKDPSNVPPSIITTASPIFKEDNGGISSWIWMIALGILLLVFCAFLGWLINDRLKKNKRRNVTRDTSAMNYENLAEDRYCPESPRGNQGRVKEATTYAVPKDCLDDDDDPNYAPVSNFNNETYAVPYQGDLYAKPVPKSERNKNEMYAQVIPKDKRTANEMYTEILPNNKSISKTLDNREQKYGNSNVSSGTMPIPKPRTLKKNKDNDLYTNVSEIGEEKRNSIYNPSDKVYYSNVNTKDKQYSNMPNQQYMNAERSEYAEPAYCEIPKYVNKK